jgi:probable DNA repair protein
VRSGTLAVPANILLVGFDRTTPLQERFLEALRSSGTTTEDAEIEQKERVERLLLIADDARDELFACAQWCRKQLEENPAKRIGVIAPDVNHLRAEAERIFREVLAPQSLDIIAEATIAPFEFSLGVPLATVPVVRAALSMLRWTIAPLPEEIITWLLLSGFVCDQPSEILSLAQMDFELRDFGSLSPETSLEVFVRSAKSSAFKERTRRLLQTIEKKGTLKENKSYMDWCDLAEQLLHASGWPGYRKPDSVQFQAQIRWQTLLDEIASLDFAGHTVSFGGFLRALEQRASEVIFTPESHNAPIQILGAFESSGQTFDALWFLGMDDSQWPPSGRRHPLLPGSLQRKAQLPHSSTAVDTQLALITTHRVARSAQEIVFSYARLNKEGELRASPLLAAVLGAGHVPLATHKFREQLQISEPARPSLALDTLVMPSETVPWPQDRVAGGANILKEQAACPFQAFAARRLAARPLNRTEWGLSALERGSLMHSVLESIWSPDTPEAFRLLALDDLKNAIVANRLDEILGFHIRRIFEPWMQKHSADPWMRAYLESEQKRMLVRLYEWMLCEAQRNPFTVEAREEKLKDVSVGSLKLNLRADRIDALSDGSHLLIDYKTGKVSTTDWQGERPNEPQLPLYAIYGNVENVNGLLFAQIRAGETDFIGRVASAKEQFRSDLTASSPFVNEPYDNSMRDRWQRSLRGLAEEFLRGEASVDPKEGPKTCQFCPFPGLCRIAEAEPTAGGDEADNG